MVSLKLSPIRSFVTRNVRQAKHMGTVPDHRSKIKFIKIYRWNPETRSKPYFYDISCEFRGVWSDDVRCSF